MNIKYILTVTTFLVLTGFTSVSAMAQTQYGNTPSTPARGGDGTRGGGDPHAGEFVGLGIKIANWLMYKKNEASNQIDAKKFLNKVKIIQESLDNDRIRTLIEFVSGPLNDQHGCRKPAIFNLPDGTIEVTRGDWALFSQRGRIEQVSLEILGLMRVSGRYSLVREMIAPHWKDIMGDSIVKNTDCGKCGCNPEPDPMGRLFDQAVPLPRAHLPDSFCVAEGRSSSGGIAAICMNLSAVLPIAGSSGGDPKHWDYESLNKLVGGGMKALYEESRDLHTFNRWIGIRSTYRVSRDGTALIMKAKMIENPCAESQYSWGRIPKSRRPKGYNQRG